MELKEKIASRPCTPQSFMAIHTNCSSLGCSIGVCSLTPSPRPPASQKVCLEDNRAGIQGVGQIRRCPEPPRQRAGFRGPTGGLHVDFRKTLQRGRCVFVSHRLSVALPSGSPHLPLPYPRSVLLWGVFGGCCPSNNILHTASL